VLTLRDDTAREAAERAVRDSEARVRTVVEDQTEFISRFTPDFTITFLNRAYAAQLGRPRDELVGSSLLELMDEAQRDRFTAQLAGLTPEAPVVSYEMGTVLPDGSPGHEHWTDRALFDEAGRLVEYQSVGRDITAAKRAEAQRELLLAELSHRVKNTLAVVQGVASRSLSGDGRSLAEAREVFTKRLRALANAHAQLTASQWRGASLRTLVEDELRPYGGRASLAGGQVKLGPRAALTLSLVLHELATNAAKHGALSAPGGGVEVAWDVDHQEGEDGARRVRLVWREAGGPAVEVPARQGFGTTLIEQSLAYDLQGTGGVRFEREGLVCELAFPLGREAG
jgi:PAS domain S-box-containing protein